MRKKNNVEREIIRENFEKNDMWKRNSRRKFWKKRENRWEIIIIKKKCEENFGRDSGRKKKENLGKYLFE